MTFAQRRKRLTTHFSERIAVVKRRMTSLFIAQWKCWKHSKDKIYERKCVDQLLRTWRFLWNHGKKKCLCFCVIILTEIWGCIISVTCFNPLNAELNPICYLLALLRAHHFHHVSRIRVKLLTLRLLMSYIYIYIYIYIYGGPILDVSRSHTTT